MSRRPVIVAVVLALAATGCSLAGAGKARPVLAAPRSVAPSAVVRTVDGNQSCVVPHPPENERQRGLVRVDPYPVGVIVVWLPGMNQRPCRAALTRGNADLARRLAKDVATAPKWPSGTFSCPADDDSSAQLYFEQSKIAQAELVEVRLAGCKGIDAPGRSARQMTDRFSRDLALIAPAPWRAGL
jgi:hypothetical protein